jgi:hypothetical protein
MPGRAARSKMGNKPVLLVGSDESEEGGSRQLRRQTIVAIHQQC